MKGKRFTEEKIITILKEHEAGVSVSDLTRRHNVCRNRVYIAGNVSYQLDTHRVGGRVYYQLCMG